jgi:hypothetical protein
MEATPGPLFNSYHLSNEPDFEPASEINHESLSKLQARISELEKELKKQKNVSDKSSKLLKLIWGDQFETDSLH